MTINPDPCTQVFQEPQGCYEIAPNPITKESGGIRFEAQ